MGLIDKENIVMGYSADEIAAFAILVDDNDNAALDVRLTAEVAARAAADTAMNGRVMKLEAWDNEEVNKARVEDWMDSIAGGSTIEGLYLGTEMAKSVASERLTYWSGMLTLLGASKKGWVAFDDERMCYVEAGLSVTGWPDMGGNKIGVVYLPDTGYIYTVAETYTNGAISAAHKMSKVGYLPYVFMDFVMQTSVKLAELEARIEALEGN